MPRIKKSIKPLIEDQHKVFVSSLRAEPMDKEPLMDSLNASVRSNLISLAKKGFLNEVLISKDLDFVLETGRIFWKSYLTSSLHYSSENKEFNVVFEIPCKSTKPFSYRYLKNELRFKNMDFERADEYIKEIFGVDYTGSARQNSSINFNPYKTYLDLNYKDLVFNSIREYLTQNEIIFTETENQIAIDFSQFRN